ncbi:MAG: DUF58 domain-containing protein [Micavibrio aeruginosavorus]|uniref:DUF58 domain-containing protein n=1 Tax=Micavibrio aeruginosavorus TaxID=349221 RepID=A0A7T5UHC9_9BACT|nr:MAG: DUF58 domain-containing protein [Micavibrio aeruginosavorus]
MPAQTRIHGLTRSALNALGLRMAAEKAAGRLPELLVAAEKAAASARMGEHTQKRAGVGEKFWQFREYQAGDRPQDIDWRQSGRSERIYVRQKEWQTTQTVLLWCQRDHNMHYASRSILPTKQDAAATLLLATTLLAARAGEIAGLLDGSLRAAKGESALQVLGEKFLEEDPASLPHRLMREPARNATVILAGDFLSPLADIEKSIHALAGRTVNVLLLQVLDPAELNLPFRGRVVFESPQSSERHHIINVDTIRESYREKINSHIQELKSICHHNGWHYIQHRTDIPAEQTLQALWHVMCKNRKGDGLA